MNFAEGSQGTKVAVFTRLLDGRLGNRTSFLGRGKTCLLPPVSTQHLSAGQSMKWASDAPSRETAAGGAKLTIHLNLVLRLSMRGAILFFNPLLFASCTDTVKLLEA
jgi:hypothetical protein